MIFVPIILWTALVMGNWITVPTWFPSFSYEFGPHLAVESNWPLVIASLYQLYYFALEPLAALIYLPQLTLSLLTATAFSKHASAPQIAGGTHAVAWIAQFIGHGVHEGRSPALLDNILGAVVLAPFFVHLELLFGLGYKPQLHKQIQNDIGKEIAKFRKEQGDTKRAAGKKD